MCIVHASQGPCDVMRSCTRKGVSHRGEVPLTVAKWSPRRHAGTMLFMSAVIMRADANLLERLLPEVRSFWAFEKLPFDRVDVRAALSTLLENPALGCVFVAEHVGEIVGYTVLTFGYSLEHGGHDGLVDELYVRESLRGRGLGTRLLEQAAEVCRQRGITRLHLEVDHTNPRAAKLYARLGFAANDRALITKKL